jgi:thiol-disulfide isomerase/thioredoxin
MSAVRRVLIAAVAAVILSSACGPSAAPTTDSITAEEDGTAGTAVSSAAGTIEAPPFPSGLDWLNTDEPIDLASLRGKIVLLDFWTYGCINCIHIIPDLKRLEDEYANELVVIGVHSAKFANEAETDNIRQIVQRYDLEHPVVNDADFQIWSAWGAQAWPTVALIDPAGNVVGTHSGEGVYDVVAPVVANLVAEFGARGELDRDPIEFSLEKDGRPDTLLSYPGKVLADPGSARLFIADTGHHRIVVADDSGAVGAVYGTGTAGFTDGAAADARFSSPQGLAVVGDTLYVADTGNHAVRQIDLATGTVSTLVGNGTKGWPPSGGSLREVALASPWALAADPPLLYVANAGTHQIWLIDLDSMVASPLVGSAVEGTVNGPLAEAQLAQPSGLALKDGILYFADSESSSIRSADVSSQDGTTALVAGGVESLFDFGDVDGVGEEARLQHPLGVAFHGDTLLVADTYNSKIKAIDVATGRTTTLYGGEQGWADGAAPLFSEPGGISVDGDVAWIADTDNHAIRRIDLTEGSATTLVLSGLDAFTGEGDDDYSGPVTTLETIAAAPGATTITLDVDLPDGYKVNEQASSSIFLSGSDVASFPEGDRIDLTGATFPFTLPVNLSAGAGEIVGDLTLVWCREDAEGLCYVERLRYEVPVDVHAGGDPATIVLPLTLEEPEL